MTFRKSKVMITMLLVSTLTFGSALAYADVTDEDSKVSVEINGEALTFEVDPYVNEDNRTMVPLRFVSEKLGASVEWDDETRSITITKDEHVMVLVLDEKEYTYDGETFVMDTEAILVDSTTLVPIRFVSEALDQYVTWDGETRTVGIKSMNPTGLSYAIVDTMQDSCWDDEGVETDSPKVGEEYYGQDSQYTGIEASYVDNGDGTVTDLNTGLMWQQTPDYSRYEFEAADAYCEELTLAEYDDWRMPTLKELYSLANFNGQLMQTSEASTPYIDTDYFDFEYDRMLYAGQYWSSTKYVKGALQSGGIEGAFGFNFADGHIKSYETGYYFDGSDYDGMVPGCFIRAVRVVEEESYAYGENQFVDNGDGTITDNATGLTWQSGDDGVTRDWSEALEYAEGLELAGYDDWRLPNAKELQSIVDYAKLTYPAIDEDFFTLTNEDSYFWTSTTQGDFKYTADYISFGKAWSTIDSGENYYDWHGAGAQRSDPKSGDPSEYLMESVNAEDLVRIYNYALCVRDDGMTTNSEPTIAPEIDETAEDMSVEPSSDMQEMPPMDENGTPPTDEDGNIIPPPNAN